MQIGPRPGQRSPVPWQLTLYRQPRYCGTPHDLQVAPAWPELDVPVLPECACGACGRVSTSSTSLQARLNLTLSRACCCPGNVNLLPSHWVPRALPCAPGWHTEMLRNSTAGSPRVRVGSSPSEEEHSAAQRTTACGAAAPARDHHGGNPMWRRMRRRHHRVARPLPCHRRLVCLCARCSRRRRIDGESPSTSRPPWETVTLVRQAR